MSRLLKSWATPPASWPIASSLRAARNCSSRSCWRFSAYLLADVADHEIDAVGAIRASDTTRVGFGKHTTAVGSRQLEAEERCAFAGFDRLVAFAGFGQRGGLPVHPRCRRSVRRACCRGCARPAFRARYSPESGALRRRARPSRPALLRSDRDKRLVHAVGAASSPTGSTRRSRSGCQCPSIESRAHARTGLRCGAAAARSRAR